MNDLVSSQVLNNAGVITISSRDIAEITNKRHDHVIRDIENALGLDAPKFGETYIDSFNRSQKHYVLPKNIALGIVSGYSFELRMKIINRLEELENLKNKPLTTSEQISLLATGHQEIEQRLSNTEDKINYLENKSPIVYNQIKVLEDKRKSRTNQLVGYNPNCEKSKANYSRTIRALTKKFKNVFGVARYADLPKDKYNEALKWVSNVEMVDLI